MTYAEFKASEIETDRNWLICLDNTFKQWYRRRYDL